MTFDKGTSVTLVAAEMPTTYQERKEAGICTRPGCEQAAAEDCNLCPRHRADNQKYARRKRLKQRAVWKKARLCLRCGRKRRQGSKWCTACLIKAGKLKKQERQNPRQITTDRTWTDATGRERYHGQAQRGRQPIFQLDDQDLEYALEAIQRARVGLAAARAPAMELLPKAERMDAIRAALSLAHLGQRHLDEVLERNRYHSNQILTRRKVRR